jgi:hypothetical protein
MTDYLIVRHGSNASNQPGCPRLPICWVEAKSQSEACRLATEEHDVTCYVNQRLEAVPRSRVSATDAREVAENEALFGR